MTEQDTDTPTSPERDLSLDRPLAIIDTDSTGLNPETARIVRISVLRLEPDGRRSLRSELVNPGLPIPQGANAVHGITDEDVANRPPFRSYARALAESLDDCDFAGFALERFHLPLLLAEFRRAGIDFSLENRAVVDAMSIYHRLEPRDFDAAYRLYAGSEERPESKSEGILQILLGQLNTNSDLPVEPHKLARWSKGVPESAVDEEGRFTYLDSGEIAFNFGKYSGEDLASVAESDASYVAWVASNESFSSESRKIAADALIEAGHEPSDSYD